ncbi:hypothetical protein [Hyalangium versicolor]|uniref:hypothetical protein n=1 Tax=Hyalangium versicolor TaxID=2861190 RepID=UPI001CCE30B0|nr:hypothetical protein [Hyalangium versicolor]
MRRIGSIYVRYSQDDSTEYCAWIYFTPKGKYEISFIATPEAQNTKGPRFCSLPQFVIDPRYVDDEVEPDKNIKYAIAIHTHPSPTVFTQEDIRYIVETEHRFQRIRHDNGRFRLGVVAFFSREERDTPACDGFFEYSTAGDTIQIVTRSENGEWQNRDYAKVGLKRVKETGKLEVTIDVLDVRAEGSSWSGGHAR